MGITKMNIDTYQWLIDNIFIFLSVFQDKSEKLFVRHS